MDVLRSDLRGALRQLRRQPIFTVTAVASLALGIGAPATIFAIANAILLRPLPVTQPERLRYVYATSPDGSSFHSFSYPMYRELREQNRSLTGLAAYDVAPLSVSTSGDATLAFGMVVSWNYFQVLGVRPALGRFFLPDEEVTPLTHPVAVADYAFWQTRLNGDPSAIGRPLTINGHPFTLVGVAAPEFHGTMPVIRPDLWTPIMMMPVTSPGYAIDRFSFSTLQLIGRLPEGAVDDPSERTLDALSKQIGTIHREVAGQGIDIHPLTALPTEAMRGVSLFVAMLLTFSVLILLVAGGNVASMLLARAIRRRRELAIRVAIGAGRGRLIRQLVVETMSLFAFGAGGALVVAWAATRAMAGFTPPLEVPLQLDAPIDARVIAFTLLIAAVVGTLLGLASALRATRGNLTPQLKEGSAGAFSRSRTWNVLVAGQMAVTVLLLAGAGLVLRALGRAASIDTGFETRGVYLASTDLGMRDYDAAKGMDVLRRWGEVVAGTPGVETVAFVRRPPLGLGNTTGTFLIDGGDRSGTDSVFSTDWNAVSPSYFDLMRVPILAGRNFGPQDAAGAPRVVIVSEAFARRWFGGVANAVDRTIRRAPNDTTRNRIIGVAANTKVRSIVEEPRPHFYSPITQDYMRNVTLLVRASTPTVALAQRVRSALREVDPGLPLMSAMTFADHIGVALVPQRLAGTVAATLGLAGLLLAATGIYGIVAYAVSQRTREIGVRVAVGATPASVVTLIAKLGMRLALAGLILGLLAASGVSRLISPFLLGVSPTDPVTFLGIAALASLVALIACVVPAMRAARVDPATALRSD